MLPYTCGAFLPDEIRNTSDSYRRVRGRFKLRHVSYPEACELVGFVRLIGVHAAKFLFDWSPREVRLYKRIEAEPKIFEGSEGFYQANLAAQSEEDGLLLLKRMREGGFREGKLPELIKLAVRSMRRRGIKAPEIARQLGITTRQARDWITPRRVYGGEGLRRSRASFSLLTG